MNEYDHAHLVDMTKEAIILVGHKNIELKDTKGYKKKVLVNRKSKQAQEQ